MANGLNLSNEQMRRGVGLGLAGGQPDITPPTASPTLANRQPPTPAPQIPTSSAAPEPQGRSGLETLGDIGFLLSSVSAGLQGTPLPEHPSVKAAEAQRKARVLALQEGQLARNMLNDQIESIDKFVKIAQDVPAEARPKLKEIALQSIGNPALAEVFEIAFDDPSIMDLAGQFGLDPEDPLIQTITRSDVKLSDKVKMLRDRADEVLMPEAIAKISAIASRPEDAFPPDVLKRVLGDDVISISELAELNASIEDESLRLTPGQLQVALRNTDILKASGLNMDVDEGASLKSPRAGDIIFADGRVLSNTTSFIQGSREVFRNPETGEIRPIPPGAEFNPRQASGVSVTLPPGETAFQKGLGKAAAERITEKLTLAEGARKSLIDASIAREALDEGAIVGLGANIREGFGRLLGAAGWQAAEDAVANTEAFVAVMGKQVLNLVSTGVVGTGTAVSDNDIKFLKDVVGGEQALTETGIRRIIGITERTSKLAIEALKEERSRLSPEDQRFVPDVEIPDLKGPKTDQRVNARAKPAPEEKPVKAIPFEDRSDDELDAELRRRGIDPKTLKPLER